MSNDNKKYIYQIYVESGILKFKKYLIVYQGNDYEERNSLIYYTEEFAYDLYIRDGLGNNNLETTSILNIYSLPEIKQKYLDLPSWCNNWYEVYYCDTNINVEELNVELSKWQKIRNDTKEQRKLKEEEKERQRKIERKQYILNQISENQNNIVNLNSKIKTVNDEYIKDIASKLISRLEKEIEKLSKELNELIAE